MGSRSLPWRLHINRYLALCNSALSLECCPSTEVDAPPQVGTLFGARRHPAACSPPSQRSTAPLPPRRRRYAVRPTARMPRWGRLEKAAVAPARRRAGSCRTAAAASCDDHEAYHEAYHEACHEAWNDAWAEGLGHTASSPEVVAVAAVRLAASPAAAGGTGCCCRRPTSDTRCCSSAGRRANNFRPGTHRRTGRTGCTGRRRWRRTYTHEKQNASRGLGRVFVEGCGGILFQ